MKKIKLSVTGMVCTGCENRIKSALETIEGVKKVTANHKKGMVIITLQDGIEESEICKVIENLGYEVGTEKK